MFTLKIFSHKILTFYFKQAVKIVKKNYVTVLREM